MRRATASYARVYWLEPRYLREFAARNPLAAAFLISLLIHATLFGGWRVGKQLGWWEHQATWLFKFKNSAKALARQSQAQRQEREIPLSFVEVDPTVVSTEAPKDAKFYGAANSKAANEDVSIETVKPKVDGTQTQIPRPDSVPKPQPLQPALPNKEKTDAISELAKANTAPKAEIVTLPTKEKEKPRTLAAAREKKGLVGEAVKQDGGNKRRGQVSFDVKQTPFGAYDAAFIAAVQQRWYDLLDATQFSQRSGKVVIEFRLTYDGRITDMRVAGNEVGEMLGLLCQRAIIDPAPYRQWPEDMRRMVGGNHRDVMFTFYYN